MMLVTRSFSAVTIPLIIYLVLSTGSIAAPPYSDPGHFVKVLGDRAIELFGSENLNNQEQAKRFRKLLREGFAVKKIGRFVLGKYRRSASKPEIREFLELFEDYIVSLYSSAFKNFSGFSFQVVRVVKTHSPNDTMVVTHINPDASDGPTKVIFQVRSLRNSFRILDIKIQGVSMVVTQRDEFTGFIRNNNGEVRALIKALREKLVTLGLKAAVTK